MIFYENFNGLSANKVDDMNQDGGDVAEQIDRFLDRPETRASLTQFEVSSSSFRDLLERLDRVGNATAITAIQDRSKLTRVLEIYSNSPSDWSDGDKFVAISNFLEYGE